MQRLLEFTHHHPYLIGAAVLIVVLFIADSLWRRLRKFREISPAEAVLLVNRGAAVIDVRTAKEFGAGHIIGARNLPLAEFTERVTELEKFREQPVLICCQNGASSQGRAAALSKAGFQQVHSLKGGISAWQSDNFPLERA
ncbi:MAG TPA: rhodanese-like domain-containing protein [Gammaproteobacteria bacterium]|nr:rhodanese-like domain-containing protein [Gammaproteobacteria bacterium]